MRNDREPDSDQICQAISLLYDAVSDGDLWPEALNTVGSLCGSPGVTVYRAFGQISKSANPAVYRGPDTRQVVYLSTDLREAGDAFFNDWIDRTPFSKLFTNVPVFHRAMWDGELLDSDIVRKDPFYNEFGHVFDLKHGMARGSSSGHVLISPLPRRTGAPSPEMLKAFDLLSNHVVKALALRSRFASTLGHVDALVRLLDLHDVGVIYVDSAGWVTECNSVASRLEGDGFRIVGRRLVASRSTEQALVDRLLAEAFSPPLDARPEAIAALSRSSGRLPLLLRAIPISRRSGDLGLHAPADGGAAVVITDPKAGTRNDSQRAFRRVGLSEAEARVAELVGAGAAPAAAAEVLRLSTGTVRMHLKSIFAKLDISKQTELVAIAGRLASLSPEAARG